MPEHEGYKTKRMQKSISEAWRTPAVGSAVLEGLCCLQKNITVGNMFLQFHEEGYKQDKSLSVKLEFFLLT